MQQLANTNKRIITPLYDRPFIPAAKLANLYDRKYSTQETNGVIHLLVNGQDISESDGDVWRVGHDVAVSLRKWIQLFGGRIKWASGKATLWTS